MGHAQVEPPPHHHCTVCKLMKQPLTNFATHSSDSFADQSTFMTNEQHSLVTMGGRRKACSCATCCVLNAAQRWNWALPWFGFARSQFDLMCQITTACMFWMLHQSLQLQ